MRFSKETFLNLGTGKWLLLCLIAVFRINTAAQHCPFDGGNMIVVHLTDAKGKPVTDISQKLTLVEINNPVAKSCSYAEGLLIKQFLPTRQKLQTHYERYWESWIKPDYEDRNFFNNGYYAVILNMSEKSCVLKKDNDLEYRKREFEIRLDGFGKLPPVKVEKENIYNLCTDGENWKRIKSIEIEAPNTTEN